MSVWGGGAGSGQQKENARTKFQALKYYVAYLYARYDDEILYSRYVVFSFDEMTIFIISLE